MKLCEHVPANESTRPDMLLAYKETRKFYEQIFRDLDPLFWPEAGSTCGDSYSGVSIAEEHR